MLHQKDGSLLSDIFFLNFTPDHPIGEKFCFVEEKFITTSSLNSLGEVYFVQIALEEKSLLFYYFFPVKYKNLFLEMIYSKADLGLNVEDFEKRTYLKFYFDEVTNLLYNLTLSDIKFTIKEGKEYNFSISQTNKNEDIHAYVMKSCLKDNKDAIFGFYFPFPKTFEFFYNIFSVTKLSHIEKNSSDINELMITLQHEIGRLKQHLYRKRITFPFDPIAFFNQLSNAELQNILTLFFSNKLITYDMLYVLAKEMRNGMDRVILSISKNLQVDFIENLASKGKIVSFRWAEVALFQISLNLEYLIKEKKMDSELVNDFKKSLIYIQLKEIQKFLKRKPFSEWIIEAQEKNLLAQLISKSNNLILAKSLANESVDIFSLVKKNISSRGIQILNDDIEYVKKSNSLEEYQIAKQEIIDNLIELEYQKIEQKFKILDRWINSFVDKYDFNYAIYSVGPIEFFLALNEANSTSKKKSLDYLLPPLSYFINDLVKGQIKLNFPYGNVRIKEAVDNVIKGFYTLERKGELNLKFD